MKRVLILLLAAAMLLACAGCGGGGDTDAGTRITFFKAGKADAILVQSQGAVIVVDTGLEKKADDLIKSMEALGVTGIDALIVTHFDQDHVGGAAELLRRFGAKKVYQSNCPKDSDEYAAYVDALDKLGIKPVTVTDAVTLSLGELSVVIDGPDQAKYADDESNNSSLIVTMTCGRQTVLFGGDAKDLRLAEYLGRYERGEGTVILKAPYHGHWLGMLPAFIEAVAPDAAILTCSKNEPDKDERLRTEALLESKGVRILRTFEGDVTLTLTKDGYELAQGG